MACRGVRYGTHTDSPPGQFHSRMGNPGIVSFGHEVAIETAVKFFGRDCIIAGNIEPAVIHMGKPDEIRRLCMATLAQGSQAPRGYILMPGCGIAPNAPTQNLLMLKKATSDFMDG